MNPDLDDGPATGSAIPAALAFATLSEHPHRCRWPLEDGWCGAATAGRRPYCAAHVERAYLPRPPELEAEAAEPQKTPSDQPNSLEAA